MFETRQRRNVRHFVSSERLGRRSHRFEATHARKSSRRSRLRSIVDVALFQLFVSVVALSKLTGFCFGFVFSSASSSTELSIKAPAQAGKWSAWALTVTRAGLRFSAPVTLEVFRPLTVDFHLPRSLKVGESAEVDIKIGNNVNSCVDVSFLFRLIRPCN